jgi:LuxR family maltose regulon positive regulatory protein
LARALGQCGHLAKAKHLLERLYRLVTREDRLRDTIQVLIVQSMTLHRNGETDAALLKLDIALTLAEPHGYIRSFVDEGKRMKELLSNYLQLRQISFIREPVNVSLLYVKQLLQTMHVNVEGALSLRSFILTEKEMNVLRMIEQGMSNQQIAEHQYILVSTVKTHIQNMYKKLKVNNRFQAVQRGKELNML